MILIDYSAVSLGPILGRLNQGQEVTEDLIRHIVLNNLLNFKRKFGQKYGEIVICCDSPNPWRKQFFPYYKANRKKAREEGTIDWNEIYRIVNTIKTELKEHMPYKVVEVETCEGDDIIAALALNFDGPHVVVSNDKDLRQLQIKKDIIQFHPNANTNDEFLICDNPEEYLLEHIIKGDSGDGIPNAYTPDDSLVNKVRQVMVTKKRLEEMKVNKDHFFERNKKLISLFEIPQELVQKVLISYEEIKRAPSTNIVPYLASKGLRKLITQSQEF